VARISLVFATIVALVVPLLVTSNASASTTRESCGFELLDFHFDATSALIDGEKDFIKDVNGFNSTIFGSGSAAEIVRDYRSSRRDLIHDFRFASGELRIVRADAISEFRGGASDGASAARLAKELAFFAGVQHDLNVAYRQARRNLRRNFLLALGL
jgi:hypothetical protein